jgi:hypothetical protein
MTALRRALLLGALLSAAATAAPAAPRVCLPPVFEGGQRLHPLPAPRVFWLELLLRQHEICWRRSAGEARIALVGNSGIFGYPLPVEQTFGGRLNAHFDAHRIPAHVFNLAFVNSYQLRDAVIIHEALAYAPDVLLYPVTFAEFVHTAPAVFPPHLVRFFTSNKPSLYELASKPPAGLAELLAVYRAMLDQSEVSNDAFFRLREVGAFARSAAQQHALRVKHALTAISPTIRTKGRQTKYNCGQILADTAWQYDHWRDWSVLGYAAELQRAGIEVVIVNWPVAHEPVDDCYNVRWSAANVAAFNDWTARESRALGLRYIDLHAFLAPEEFLDSLHLSPAGHQRVADRLAAELDPVIRSVRGRQTGSRP